MNVPTEFEQDIPPDLPPLPFMREFLLPEEGHVWLKRDFSSQEVRIAGHFEDGPLCRAYNENPRLDPHSMAHGMILSTTGKDYPRKHVKITGFQILYGGGAPAISQGVGCSLEEAALLKTSYFQAMPGLYQLIQDVTALGRSGQPITTWGGRKYYTEKSAKFPSRDFSYKLTNYLIQGSAADQTKQCIIDWETAQSDAVFLATVHDELNISAPVDNWKEHMAFLREVMNRDRLDVPMLSEGFVGENWHDIEETE
jgi:DNA polymerase I-like protein with 3'-5' exonuclease and polymerase domains